MESDTIDDLPDIARFSYPDDPDDPGDPDDPDNIDDPYALPAISGDLESQKDEASLVESL